jgi:hypothetical protein
MRMLIPGAPAEDAPATHSELRSLGSLQRGVAQASRHRRQERFDRRGLESSVVLPAPKSHRRIDHARVRPAGTRPGGTSSFDPSTSFSANLHSLHAFSTE